MRVIFDVDGTLTRTFALDASLFARAFREVAGRDLPSLDWTTYRHATSRGIAEEALGAAARDSLDSVRMRFLSLLEEHLPRQGLAVAGATDVLREFGASAVIATGCFRDEACLKLLRAGIEIEAPIYACDGEPSREGILRAAAAGAERAVYVGDGPWDVAACRRLAIAFVGIDAEGSGRLRGLGHFEVLRDFRDRKRFHAALTAAAVP